MTRGKILYTCSTLMRRQMRSYIRNRKVREYGQASRFTNSWQLQLVQLGVSWITFDATNHWCFNLITAACDGYKNGRCCKDILHVSKVFKKTSRGNKLIIRAVVFQCVYKTQRRKHLTTLHWLGVINRHLNWRVIN